MLLEHEKFRNRLQYGFAFGPSAHTYRRALVTAVGYGGEFRQKGTNGWFDMHGSINIEACPEPNIVSVCL